MGVATLEYEVVNDESNNPARLKKDKEDAYFKKFLDDLMQLHINLLLVEACP